MCEIRSDRCARALRGAFRAGGPQDGQEFLKLLLQALEHRLTRAGMDSGVAALFRGVESHRTVCHGCQRPSPASANTQGFYELARTPR